MGGKPRRDESPCSPVSGAVRRRREQFIPVPRGELVDAFARDLAADAADRERLEHWCDLLAGVVHREFHDLAESLKQAYLPFDPDSDTQSLVPFDATEEQRRYETICFRLQDLLRRANFRQLSQRDMEAALAGMNEWGVELRVDFARFERLEVFARGDVSVDKRRRRLRNLFRSEQIDLPVYQRLVVLFRLRNPSRDESLDRAGQPLFIKLFKDIPQTDIESLLPGTSVQMTWFDRGRILVPTIAGLSMTIVKLVQGALALVFAGIYGILAFLGLVCGTIGYALRTFFSFLQTKNKYQLHLTRNLYFLNLDNNRGAILRLLDEAEEQEFREVLLAYFLLWRDAPAEGWASDELDRAAEAWLEERLKTNVDFEIPDALDKLERLGLAQRLEDGRWRAATLDEAFQRLASAWRDAARPPGRAPEGPGVGVDSAVPPGRGSWRRVRSG